MSTKRTKKDDGPVPKKKRHIELNNENVNTTNLSMLQARTSQLLPSRSRQGLSESLNFDPTLKSGKIKSILLRNFMCHSNLKVKLNNNVNIFVGLNGSGKSAILAALAIGLGSKASSTSRSTNLKDLVKVGEQSATIEITLSNDGIDAFEDDVYGKEIIVTRTINGSSGSSSYKLKSATGRVVSTNRQDLNKLTMCLNIQVENPVLILNQDAARSFLKECDPHKMYTLFLKATQLEAIIEMLHACLSCVASSQTQLEYLLRSIKHFEGEIEVIREKHGNLQSVALLRNNIASCKNELEWLKVSQVEKELLDVQKLLANKREQLARITDYVKNRAKMDKELKEKIRDYGTEFAALRSVVEQKEEESQELRRTFAATRNELSEMENSWKTLQDRKIQFETNQAQLENDIAEKEANPLNVANMRKQNEEKVATLEKKKGDLTLIIGNARRDCDNFTETLNDYRERIERCKGQLSRIQEEIQKQTYQIQQFKGSTKDTLAVYGGSMSKLVKRIEQLHKQKKFEELPRGPLGRYIEVTDASCKSAVESILGGILTAFYVHCDRDRIQLNQLFTKEFPEFAKLQIITGKFFYQVHDVRNGIAQLQRGAGQVLMEAIKVSDPVVMNCLIDQRQIETVVLVESTEHAIELTQDEENVPVNLRRVILLKPLSEFFPAPNYRSYAMREFPARYIQTDHKEVIAGYENQKELLQQKVPQIRELMQELQDKARDQEKLFQQKKRLVGELQQKDRGYTDELRELKAVEYPPEDEIEYNKKELEELKKKNCMTQKKIAEIDEKRKPLQEQMQQHELIMQKSRNEIKESRDQMSKLQIDIENVQQQLNEMNTDIKVRTNQLPFLRAEENEFAKQESEHNQNIESIVREIDGERVRTERSEETIKQVIRMADKRIRNIESSKDSIEDVELQLSNKVQQIDKMIKTRDVLDQVLQTLTTVRLSRFQYIKRLRQHMSLRCQHKFSVLMSLRSYSAEVNIDHKDKTLELSVIPRDTQIDDAVSNTKSLSGGERSYSTVALLIALWSCVDHPFYFLDEYDVFSDEHNRHMMTQLLFNEADKKRDKQYGFLTPQNFSNIQASDTITIHKLDDPERKN